MMQFSLQTQAQIAGGVALLCLVFGAAAWEIATGRRKWLGRATIAGGVLQLMAFSHHAVGQYQVILATTQIRVVEIASSDNGRQRTIQRISCPDGVLFERVLTAGWSTTGGAYRHRQSASGAVLRRVDESTRGSAKIQGGAEGAGGGDCRCLEVPGCCSGGCADCQCNQLEITGNGRQF